jgi:membrane protease subunit (stomatin/prohibitin family)
LNLPLVGKALTERVFGQSPFKAEVYFVNQKVFLNIKWGTRDPIAYRDHELALVRLRAFGLMSVRVNDPTLFVNKVVGTQGIYVTREISGFLRGLVVSSLAQVLAEQLDSLFDLPRQYSDLALAARLRTFEEFAQYGLELVDLFIDSISPPDEVQKRIDERSGIAAVGNLDAYMKFKAAQALEDAAKQPGGGAGSAIGIGAGLGLGQAMAGALAESLRSAPGNGVAGAVECARCHAPIPGAAKFCAQCGSPSITQATCTNCQAAISPGAKFCASCGTSVA